MQSAAEKYREAIELYSTTDLTLSEISERCGVTRSGLARYIQKRHRDLMMRRHGVEAEPTTKLRRPKGQRRDTREKYREAILACDSEKYIHLNISQVARLFGLDGTALANQLRAHYPDLLPRREAERRKRGLADNIHRGVRKFAEEAYGPAVHMLETSDCTIEQAADRCGVSFTGLRQHLLFYHHDLVEAREQRRRESKPRAVSAEMVEKYAEAVRLRRTTALTLAEIASRTGVTVNGLRHHLRKLKG